MELSNTNKGSLMIEMCITLALFTIIVSYSTLAYSGLSQASTRIQLSRIKLYDDKEKLERALIKEQTHIFGSIDEDVIIRDLTQCKKILYVNEFETLVADSQFNKDSGYDCGGKEPYTTHFGNHSSSTIFASTTAFDVFRSKAYITASSVSTSSPTFFVYDSTSPPTFISSLITQKNGNAIDVIKDYAFIAAQGTENQFQIIDTSNIYNPVLVHQSSLPGVSGSYPSAISIYYYNSKVYIGTHRTAGREFHIFDVSNPYLPQWQGSIEVNHNINDIAVRNGYAYLATSGNTKDIIVLDISDPARIFIASSFSFLGNEDTWSVFLIGNTLYAGRAKSTDISHQEIIALSIQDILNPTVVGAYRFNMKVTSLKVINNTLFTSVTGTKSGLYAIDISSIASTSALSLISSKIPIIDIDYENGTLYSLFQDGTLSVMK